MQEQNNIPYGVYRFTSIARPVETRFPTNRAVLKLLPLAAGIGAGIALFRDGDPVAALFAGLMFALVAFGGWALTRELAPDDNPAAFIGMALAVATLFAGADAVLLVFIAMFLARVVNRTTGLGPRVLDSILVAGLASWASFGIEQPLIGLIGSFAFAADATFADGRRWQFLPSGVCLVASTWATLANGIPLEIGTLKTAQGAFLVLATAAYLYVVYRSRKVTSIGDIYGLPLSPSRVQVGMVVGLLVAWQAVLTRGGVAFLETPIWASIVAVPLGVLLGGILGKRRPGADNT